MALGKTMLWGTNINSDRAVYQAKEHLVRAKEGNDRLLREHSVKAVNAAFLLASLLPSNDERFTELRQLWEIVIVSLPPTHTNTHASTRARARQPRRTTKRTYTHTYTRGDMHARASILSGGTNGFVWGGGG